MVLSVILPTALHIYTGMVSFSVRFSSAVYERKVVRKTLNLKTRACIDVENVCSLKLNFLEPWQLHAKTTRKHRYLRKPDHGNLFDMRFSNLTRYPSSHIKCLPPRAR